MLDVFSFCSVIALIVAGDPVWLPDVSSRELVPPGTEMPCEFRNGIQSNYFRPCDDDTSLYCNYRMSIGVWQDHQDAVVFCSSSCV